MLTPTQIAILLALIFELFVQQQQETRRSGATRFRMRRSTFRRIAGREQLRDSLIEAVIDELSRFGLILFASGDEYCIIQASSAEAFPRLRYEGPIRELVRKARTFDATDWKAEESRLQSPTDPAADDDG